MRRLAILLVGAWIVLFFGLWMFQEWLIFPGRVSQGTEWSRLKPVGLERLVTLRSNRGETITAWISKVDPTRVRDDVPARDRPVALLFYGNAMSMKDFVDWARVLPGMGVHVAMIDYPGYGMSGGKPSEAGIAAAVDALLVELKNDPELNTDRIVTVGWSLGAAVAFDTAFRHREVRGVAGMCSFTSIPDVGRDSLFFLPLNALVRHPFNNAAKVPQLDVPIFLGHGRRDSIVPFRMSPALEKLAKVPVETMYIDNANHNDYLMYGGDTLINRIATFAWRCAGSPTTRPGL